MSRILVFDSWEDTYEQLVKGHCEHNLETRLELRNRYNKKLVEYNSLPLEEHQEFLRQYPNLGQGLELTCIIGLDIVGKKYFYQEAQDGLCPSNLGRNDSGYKKIIHLVRGIQELVRDQDKMYFGARLNTILYTIDEEMPVFTDEEKQNMREAYEEFKSDDLMGMNFLQRWGIRFFSKLLVTRLLGCKDKIRGLNKQEREEFERLYSKEIKK